MPLPATIEICQKDLFTAEDELKRKYDEITVRRLLRLREMYAWAVANPDAKDRQFVEVLVSRHRISQAAAYSALAIVKSMIPRIAEASRDYHRWRANEMLLETYQTAKKRKDTKTMERAASSYAKYNRVDIEDERAMPYDRIVVQPFTATDDPTVLGIKPIPNINEKIKEMLDKYRKETIDIEDIEFEEADLEEDELFGDGSAKPTVSPRRSSSGTCSACRALPEASSSPLSNTGSRTLCPGYSPHGSGGDSPKASIMSWGVVPRNGSRSPSPIRPTTNM